MKILLPETVDDTTLTASDVAETVAAYSAGTSYAAGAQVRDDASHKLFESLVGSNLGNPLTDVTKWLDRGPTNRWGMFDRKLGTLGDRPAARQQRPAEERRNDDRRAPAGSVCRRGSRA